MIRRILLASAGAMALAGTAFAADLPIAPPPPPPPPMWTGLYIGINAGGTWGNSNSTNVVSANVFNNTAVLSPLGLTYGTAAALGSTAFIPASSNGGFIGGGQIGYNYQFYNSWVAGLEADIQGIATSNSTIGVFTVTPRTPFFPPDAVDTNIFTSRKLSYIGTVRGRIGFLVTPTLLAYGTGGLAYGGIKSTTGIFGQEDPNTGSNPFFGAGFASTTQIGWTAGGGVEWMFLPNWSVKAEYLYYNLGSVTYNIGPLSSNLTTGATSFVNTAAARTHFNGNIVRAGIDYHFYWGAPAPVVAKY
jgi:outer membrane immunogenic protein